MGRCASAPHIRARCLPPVGHAAGYPPEPSPGDWREKRTVTFVPCPGLPTLGMELVQHAGTDADDVAGPLSQLLAGNAMQPALPLLEALALERGQVLLPAGTEQWLRIDIGHG